MPNLKCSVCNCGSNEDGRCCRPDIDVKGPHACDCEDTCCHSFTQQNDQSAVNSSGYQHPNDALEIHCSAENCVYNDNKLCTAESIDIDGNGANNARGTQCSTFEEK